MKSTQKLTPGYWCKKLQDYIDSNKITYFNVFPGENINTLDIEGVAQEIYEVLSGQRKGIDLTNKII